MENGTFHYEKDHYSWVHKGNKWLNSNQIYVMYHKMVCQYLSGIYVLDYSYQISNIALLIYAESPFLKERHEM